MCLGTPMQLVAVDGIVGTAATGHETATVDLSLVPEARPGDHLLVFLGTARSVIDVEAALRIADAHRAVAAAMSGLTDVDAFADLSAPPRLPPHLEAARRAGRSDA